MSTQVENTGVNHAVERLLELADRMRDVDFGFNDKDINNIDKIIEAIHELDEARRKMHERLETKTIHASILRHKLQFLPAQIRDEIKAAVSSARQSNASAQNEMQEKLELIQKNMSDLEDQQHVLDKENAKLHPERELIRQKHEEIISQLNERMAEKANMQIILNETRDKVRQTNQSIVDLEDGILQLKEDLIQERTEARQEKKKLKRAVTDTSDMTKEQKQINVDKKKELDVIHEKMMESDGKLDALRTSLRRYETSKAKLEGQERQLNAQLSKQLKLNEELRRKGTAIINEDMKLQKEFEDSEKQLLKKLKRLETETEKENDKNAELEGRKLELRIDLEEKQRVREDDAVRVREYDEELQAEKRALALKAEEMGRMQSENVEMADQIESLAESHKAVLAQLNKQIEGFREQLSKERKERLEVQERKNSVQKDVEDYKLETQRFLNEMNQKIREGKAEHMQLTNEGTSLQKELKEEEEVIKQLDTNLKEAQTRYTKMYETMQQKVDKTEHEINTMETQIEEKKKLIEERTPLFEELERVFEERTNAYNATKRNIAIMRQKKSGLEESIRKTKEEKAKMDIPKKQVKEDLKRKREETMFQLKRQGDDRQKLEQEIYMAGCKLRTIMEENQKLEEGCQKLAEEIEELRKQMEENAGLKVKLEDELEEVKTGLIRSWQNDEELNNLFTNKDQIVVDQFSELLHQTEEREVRINKITNRLNEELMYLSKFLENLATRRPQHTPPPSRKSGSRASSRRTEDGRTSRISQSALHSKLQDVDNTSAAPSRLSTRPPTRADTKMSKTVTIIDEPEVQDLEF
ncbi:putative leucine-rich repeat-containing protein DDB_G0290503 isoform X1 [Saccostrea echinata]|uniref:putative leucine-rich repeat-containing protein DDB_G0290503 isoform X1 n=1 Tax=Saccostrea echinata TaxID=191078 RepID=UPI002A7F13A5|nr:putative leucine-rich repeat-containing protein DDB_G0290503 isoform X1 [Saccostrea echinata]